MDIASFPSITLGKYHWWGTNHHELIGIKNEIFNEQIYAIDLRLKTSDLPLSIIDAGAHVGLAALYFKLHYPAAHIICVEPHPLLAQILQYNLWFNRLEKIEVIEAALSDQAGSQTLHADASDDLWLSTTGKSGAWDQQQTTTPLTVKTITLDSLLDQPVDLLKMDIEGFELTVLRSCRQLSRINQIILELHPPISPAQIQTIFRHSHTVQIYPHHYGLKLCRMIKLQAQQ